MPHRLYRTTLFALYQTSIAIGILLLPVALLCNRVGLSLPIHRVITPLQHAYERANAAPDR